MLLHPLIKSLRHSLALNLFGALISFNIFREPLKLPPAPDLEDEEVLAGKPLLCARNSREAAGGEPGEDLVHPVRGDADEERDSPRAQESREPVHEQVYDAPSVFASPGERAVDVSDFCAEAWAVGRVEEDEVSGRGDVF